VLPIATVPVPVALATDALTLAPHALALGVARFPVSFTLAPDAIAFGAGCFAFVSVVSHWCLLDRGRLSSPFQRYDGPIGAGNARTRGGELS
jgi:hypothetical protein